MRSTKYLFYLNTFNDTDHISPVIFRFLENKEKVFVRYISDFDFSNDYRINFLLKNYPLEVDAVSKFEKLKYKILNNRYSTKIRSIFPKKLNLFISKLFNRELSHVSCIIYEWGEAEQYNFFEAKYQSIPTVCLPHGLSCYLNHDVNISVSNLKKTTGKWPDFSNRNNYDAYVTQSERNSKNLEVYGLSRKKLKVWGSVRFFPDWAKLNLNLLDKFEPKMPEQISLKVLIILPHWSYNIDIEKTIDCIKAICSDESLFVVIKGHTRGTGSLSEGDISFFEKFKNVISDAEPPTPALIDWCDICINIGGSSIGYEAVLQDKITIFPKFLTSNKMVWENFKVAKIPSNFEQLSKLIEFGKKKNLSLPSTKVKADFLKKEIYANKAPHDITKRYYDEIKKIGSQGNL